MGLFDRARSLLMSPADRRLAAAREAWSGEPKPARQSTALAAPFSGGQQPMGRAPPINYRQDQIEPSPQVYRFQSGYSDHTYQSFSAPYGFEGFTLERIRAAVAAHRSGMFLESSTMMVSLMGFAPILAALQQAVSPILALRRHIHGGDKGLARVVAGEIEEAICPRGGLMPSPYVPPTLWGSCAINLRMMGFDVFQHVDGDPDPDTKIRPRYTRRWPSWAVTRSLSPNKWLAQTSEGAVEIKNDGHFTLVADEENPHHTGAVVCLGDEVFLGKITQEMRAKFLLFFGDPKLWATMPDKWATGSDAGNAFADALDMFYGPEGRAVLPYGSEVDVANITGQGSKAFQDAILDTIIHIYMVLTGSAGTIGSGGPTGAGPYQPQKGGPWNVRHDLIARPTICIARAMNVGHIKPYCDINYGDAIARARKAGAWKDPVLDIPLPAPDRDERIASVAQREKWRCEITEMRLKSGYVVDEDKLADDLEIRHLARTDTKNRAPIFEWEAEQKLFSPDEIRERKDAPPLPDGIGGLDRLAEERAKGIDKIGQTKIADAGTAPTDAPEPNADPATQAGASTQSTEKPV